MIRIGRLGKTFRTSRGGTHAALRDISLEIGDGEFVSILGPSGCGKSTLLYIVGGFEHATSGSVEVDGAPVREPGPDRGPVFQEYALFPWKTVLGNVAYGLRQQGVPKREAEERAMQWLGRVKLDAYAHFYPKELSGGMRQRAAIARTLAYEPKILLMDEPFGALDAHTRTTLQAELLALWEHLNNTVLFVTHGVDEAVYLSDRVVVLGGTPGTVKEIITIDLPRPRLRESLLRDSRYQEYVIRLERLLSDYDHEGQPA
jgi:NitT/TauT family transport system ATP-binding protein